MRDSDQHTLDQWREHTKRLDEIRAAFDRGEIDVERKRSEIAIENMGYYRDPASPLCRVPIIPNDVSRIQAETKQLLDQWRNEQCLY